jgi:ElaB/YqjD/DUF883 family membrane-anchored ribosome-binding protein
MNAPETSHTSSASSTSSNWTPSSSGGSGSQTAKLAEQGSAEFQSLRDDLNSLKATVTDFITQAGEDAKKTAKSASAHVTAQMSGAASNLAEKGTELASAATEQAKTFASELEAMGRKNPLGAMAAAMMVGVLIGLIGRGRS